MKKLSIVLILILLFTTACSENTFEDYQAALSKTENIQRGKVNTEMGLNLSFNTEGLAEEDLRQIKSFEQIVYEGTTSFDYTGENKQVSSLNLISLGGLGMNFDFFMNGENMALYIPMLGKYLDLSTSSFESADLNTDQFEAFSNITLSDETLTALEKIWSETFEADEIVKGEKSTMETPEGDVRVVKFTVTPEKEKLKVFIKKAATVIFEDEQLKEALHSQFSKDVDTMVVWEGSVEEILKSLDESMAFWEVEKFEVVDFIDVDGYIVESNVAVGLSFNATRPGTMKSFQMDFRTRYYEIEKAQDIVFPELTEENSVTIDTLQQGLPSTYENLLN